METEYVYSMPVRTKNDGIINIKVHGIHDSPHMDLALALRTGPFRNTYIKICSSIAPKQDHRRVYCRMEWFMVHE